MTVSTNAGPSRGTTTCSIPSTLAVAAAVQVSSRSRSCQLRVKAVMGASCCSHASAATSDESVPPDRNTPRGWPACNWRLTASRSARSTSRWSEIRVRCWLVVTTSMAFQYGVIRVRPLDNSSAEPGDSWRIRRRIVHGDGTHRRESSRATASGSMPPSSHPSTVRAPTSEAKANRSRSSR